MSSTYSGRDERGEAVGSGVYFSALQVGDAVTTRKMTILR
jgi:hypothetical protein